VAKLFDHGKDRTASARAEIDYPFRLRGNHGFVDQWRNDGGKTDNFHYRSYKTSHRIA
jgi:hypothetical protein